jgi:3-hydroxyisobutyrate dehydrogenase-like beta-hydroxyacid dehydrogenase
VANMGILHPGAMGISVAATALNGNHQVYWVSEGRSSQTHERAGKFALRDTGTLKDLCDTCEIIVSVCPPHAAEAMAEQVAAQAYRGIYLDANAISPQRAIRVGKKVEEAGARFVDGGIIGGPAWEPGKTWLYLSGDEAGEAAAFFSAGPLETCVLGNEVSKASALKMCYAAYTKGTSALLCAIMATAEALGVREDLESQWSRGGSDFAETTRGRVRRVTAKAWRFAGEMDEIAGTFREAGLPGEFHAAAGVIYRRIADFKDSPSTPSLEEVLEALMQTDVQAENLSV